MMKLALRLKRGALVAGAKCYLLCSPIQSRLRIGYSLVILVICVCVCSSCAKSRMPKYYECLNLKVQVH